MNLSLAEGSWIWLLPAIVAACALAFWAYRFAVPAVAIGLRRGLGLARVVALLLLLGMIARPLLSIAQRGESRTVVVLEDASLSMELPGHGSASRAEDAARVVADLERRLSGSATVRRWRFAGGVLAADADSSRNLEPAATDLGRALAETGRLTDVVAVVVVSDGVVNRGADPVQGARRLGRPISAVAIGEAPTWDAAIEEVAVAPLARLGEESAMEVRLSHDGAAARRARLEVSDGTTVLVTRDITLATGGEETVERLTFTPRKLGLSHYRVRLDAGADEPVSANNVRAAVQRVLPDRQRVLVLAGALHWDFTWMRRALDADSAFAAEYALASAAGLRAPHTTKASGGGLDVGPLDRYAVIVLQGLSAERLPRGMEERLVAFVRAGGSLVLWGGPGPQPATLGEWEGSPLGRVLGIAAGQRLRATEVEPELAEREASHDLVRLDDDPDRNRRYFGSLPPVTHVSPVAVRPGDHVLVAGMSGRVPLIALRRAGRAQVLLVNGAGLWRWGMSGIDPLAPERYRRFWAQALRLLSEPVQTEPLRVAVDRALAARGETVRVTASLQDADFQPVPGAEVKARVARVPDSQGETGKGASGDEIVLSEAGAGSYGGVLEGLAPGRYRVSATARHRAVGESRAETEFVVDSWTPEALAVRPDRALLEAMAAASGGVMVELGALARLSEQVGQAVSRPTRWSERRLWEEPILYLALLGLLAGEWWNRRRRGLP